MEWAATPGVCSRMQKQRSSNTEPEIALRRALHRRGLRYRLEGLIGEGTRRRVDIVFAVARVAVFVDGCFWHGCPTHGRREHRINSWYWPDKIEGNRARDRDTNKRLRSAGWKVVRVWEHRNVDKAAAK